MSGNIATTGALLLIAAPLYSGLIDRMLGLLMLAGMVLLISGLILQVRPGKTGPEKGVCAKQPGKEGCE